MDKYFPGGELKAKFIRYLRPGECPCRYDSKPEYFTQGNRVYKKIPFKFNPK